jgi:hypothetical protein
MTAACSMGIVFYVPVRRGAICQRALGLYDLLQSLHSLATGGHLGAGL